MSTSTRIAYAAVLVVIAAVLITCGYAPSKAATGDTTAIGPSFGFGILSGAGGKATATRPRDRAVMEGFSGARIEVIPGSKKIRIKGGSGHTIKDSAGNSKPARTFLRYTSPFQVTDDAGANETRVYLRFHNTSTSKRKTDSIVNIRDYRAICDGIAHPLSSRYTTLSAAQAAFPLTTARGWLTSLSDYIDWAAIQESILTAESSLSSLVDLDSGWCVTNRTVYATGDDGALTILGRGGGYYGGVSYDWVRPSTAILSDGDFVILDARRSNITLSSFHVSDLAQSTNASVISNYSSSKVGIYIGNADKINQFTTIDHVSATGLYGGVHYWGGAVLRVTNNFFGWVKDYGFLQEDDWDVDTADKLYAHNYFKTVRDTAFPGAAGLKITGGGGVKISDNTFQGLTHGVLVDGKVAVNNGGSLLAGTVMLHIINNTFDNSPYNIRIRRGASNHTGYSSILIQGNTFGVYDAYDLGSGWSNISAIDIDGYETSIHPIDGVKINGNNSYTGGDYFLHINNANSIDVANNGSNGVFTTVYSIGSGVNGGKIIPGVHEAGYTTLIDNQSLTVKEFSIGDEFYTLTRPGVDKNLIFTANDIASSFSFLNLSSSSARNPGMYITNFDGNMHGGIPLYTFRKYKGSISDTAANRVLTGSGNILGRLTFESSDGVSSGAVGASISAVTTAEWSSTNSPARLSLALGGGGVGPSGTTEIVSVESDGIHLASGKKYYGDGSQLTNTPKFQYKRSANLSGGANSELQTTDLNGIVRLSPPADNSVFWMMLSVGVASDTVLLYNSHATNNLVLNMETGVTTDGSSGNITIPALSFLWLSCTAANTWVTTASSGVSDLTTAVLLAGRSGGQTVIGGTAANDDLVLQGTSGNATSTGQGNILFKTGNNGGTVAGTVDYNGRWGIGGSHVPQAVLDITSDSNGASVRMPFGGGIPRTDYYKAGTSISSPTAVPNGTLNALNVALFHDGTSYKTTGYTAFVVNGSVATNSVPTDYQILTGSSSATERLRIKSDGQTYFSNSAGLPSGNMYSNTSTTITVASSGTWYEVDTGASPDFTAGQLTGVTFSDHYLVAPVAGKYLINAAVSFGTSSASDEIAVSVAVNGTAQASCHGHATVVNAATTVPSSCTTILSLAANDQVSLTVQNHTAARDITLSHSNMTMLHVAAQ